MTLTGDVKIVTKDNNAQPVSTINASICNNALFSLFKSARLTINGVGVDVQSDFPHITQVMDTVSTTELLRKGIVHEGGWFLIRRGHLMQLKQIPHPEIHPNNKSWICGKANVFCNNGSNSSSITTRRTIRYDG